MIGSHLVKELAQAGHAVRALVRDRAKAAHIAGPSVELVVGDLSHARADLKRRYAGEIDRETYERVPGTDRVATT